jgi:hypothetical protein
MLEELSVVQQKERIVKIIHDVPGSAFLNGSAGSRCVDDKLRHPNKAIRAQEATG